MRAFNLLEGRAHLYLDNNGLRIGTWYPAALGYAFFGVTNLGLVIYPLVMSVLAIVVMARLGTRLFDHRTGLTAALLLAFYPLDVELSTRLLRDALLSAWSLVAVYLLSSADLAQEETPGLTTVRKPWWYFLSGAALGWCTAVNMSAIVLLVFVGV
jgi:4-amino-4-deoxy-L-arabinose transferase-like glycosyltransferase